MSFEQDFERIWKSVISSVSGTLTGKQRETNIVTIDDAVLVWMREMQNWDDPMRVQNSFLVMLRRKNPENARRFREALDGFRFKTVALEKLPSSVPYITGTIGTAALGGLMGGILPETSFLPQLIGRIPTVLAGSVFLAGLGGSVMRGLWQTKTHNANEGAAQKYTDQLKPLHDTLLKICKESDKE